MRSRTIAEQREGAGGDGRARPQNWTCKVEDRWKGGELVSDRVTGTPVKAKRASRECSTPAYDWPQARESRLRLQQPPEHTENPFLETRAERAVLPSFERNLIRLRLVARK